MDIKLSLTVVLNTLPMICVNCGVHVEANQLQAVVIDDLGKQQLCLACAGGRINGTVEHYYQENQHAR